MKGIFELRKPKPKYNSIWDVSVVLKYLGTFTPNEEQTLKKLTLKLVMLLLLVTGKRGQTIDCLSLSEMTLSETSCEFQVLEHMKTSKPGSGTTILKIEQYTPDKNICPILVLREYLKRTKSVRGDNKQLFVSYQKPYQPVSRDTISRWVKVVLDNAGIDTTVYSAHSTRAAATSKAYQSVPLDILIKSAGWSSDSTFQKYFNKPVASDMTMTEAVLTTC
jgi:integrase